MLTKTNKNIYIKLVVMTTNDYVHITFLKCFQHDGPINSIAQDEEDEDDMLIYFFVG